MNEQIAVQDNAVSLEFCNHVVDMMGKGGVATVGENLVNSKVRRSNVTFLNNLLDHWSVYRPLIDLVDSVNKQFYEFSLDFPEPFQITRYDSSNQGHYTPHKDSSVPDEGGRERKLSIVLQLSPPESYEGGHLNFPNIETYQPEMVMQQGTAVIFPSYLLHGVTPVTQGTRHSLVGWFSGPKFR